MILQLFVLMGLCSLQISVASGSIHAQLSLHTLSYVALPLSYNELDYPSRLDRNALLKSEVNFIVRVKEQAFREMVKSIGPLFLTISNVDHPF